MTVEDGVDVPLRVFLTCEVMDRTGCGPFVAIEAVSSTAIEHPEWDLDEVQSFAEWLRRFPGSFGSSGRMPA